MIKSTIIEKFNCTYTKEKPKYSSKPPKNSIYFEADQVGDSDNDDFNQEIKLNYGFNINSDNPPLAEDMTIYCKDGVLKGNILIYICDTLIKTRLNSIEGLKNSGWIEENSFNYVNFINERKQSKESIEDSLETKPSGIKLNVQYVNKGNQNKDVRLYLPKNFKLCGKNITEFKPDLAYTDIAEAAKHILLTTNIKDSELATYQLQQLSGENSVKLLNNHSISFSDKTSIAQFLDFLNVLMFIIEATRIPNVIVTGLMLLELVKENKKAYTDIFGMLRIQLLSKVSNFEHLITTQKIDFISTNGNRYTNKYNTKNYKADTIIYADYYDTKLAGGAFSKKWLVHEEHFDYNFDEYSYLKGDQLLNNISKIHCIKDNVLSSPNGGMFPLNTNYTETYGCYSVRAFHMRSINKGVAYSMKSIRQNPQWLALILKEAHIIKEWLALKFVEMNINPRSEQRIILTKQINTLVEDILLRNQINNL